MKGNIPAFSCFRDLWQRKQTLSSDSVRLLPLAISDSLIFQGVNKKNSAKISEKKFPFMTRHGHLVFFGDSNVLCPTKIGTVIIEIFALEKFPFAISVSFTYKKPRAQFI